MKFQIIITAEEGKPLKWELEGDNIPGLAIKQALLQTVELVQNVTLQQSIFSTARVAEAEA
jgi:hypothetical protein